MREQLFNKREIGPIQRVSIPEYLITSLHGILLDLDPKMFWVEAAHSAVQSSPRKFYAQIIRPMLDRNDLLAKAHVRISGGGLHVIIMFDAPVMFLSENDRRHWAAIVKVVQRLLPTDPSAPGINAMTRPVGSINSKNGATVKLLASGEPTSPDAVLKLVDRVRVEPFRVIAGILFGADPISPCPICRTLESTLDTSSTCGRCYRKCGPIQLSDLYNVFLAAPRKGRGK